GQGQGGLHDNSRLLASRRHSTLWVLTSRPPRRGGQQPPPETSPAGDRRHYWRGSILSPQSPSQALSPPRAE
ncbi:Ubiquitin-Conjugating Enzyme E2 E1, partial [Manis pentadactyla]